MQTLLGLKPVAVPAEVQGPELLAGLPSRSPSQIRISSAYAERRVMPRMRHDRAGAAEIGHNCSA
jgi:hypothetical protein